MLSIDVSRDLMDFRKGAGFTQQELADILMTTAPTICKIEKGLQKIDAVMYLNWLHVCTTEPMMFIFNKDEGTMQLV